MLAGGTWLGCTPGGRVAMLTNVREATPLPAQLRRADLPMHWLSGHISATDFLAQHEPGDYGGCNLIFGDFGSVQWHWASNREFQAHVPGPQRIQRSTRWHSQRLKPGIYGLSNAFLDTPWPKTLALKAAMQSALDKAMASGDESEDGHIPSLTQSKSAILRVQIPTKKSGRFAVRLRQREDAWHNHAS